VLAGERIVEGREMEDPAAEPFGHNADEAALHRALALLADSDRELLVELFWEERTEAEIARSRHIRQPALALARLGA
jgi:DNA-directed RNA polymerase specialized sigma24 family protein